jgi:hypothetical protein
MKKFITKNILLSSLLLSLTSYALAAPALPISSQITAENKITIVEEARVEIGPEIKIEVQNTNSVANPKLKEGTACSDENLEEMQGTLFTEIPMAETIPCDKVDCGDLSAAKMYKDNYKKLQNAKTIACDK